MAEAKPDQWRDQTSLVDHEVSTKTGRSGEDGIPRPRLYSDPVTSPWHHTARIFRWITSTHIFMPQSTTTIDLCQLSAVLRLPSRCSKIHLARPPRYIRGTAFAPVGTSAVGRHGGCVACDGREVLGGRQTLVRGQCLTVSGVDRQPPFVPREIEPVDRDRRGG